MSAADFGQHALVYAPAFEVLALLEVAVLSLLPSLQTSGRFSILTYSLSSIKLMILSPLRIATY